MPSHARAMLQPSSSTGLAGSLTRLGAMVLRHIYLMRSSWPRMFDLVYWPTMQMVLWGFIQTYLAKVSGFFAQAFGILLGAVILWDVFFRSQIAFTMSFLEEIWSRNLGHLLVTPLKTGELIASMIAVSFLRTILGLIPASLVAVAFFGFSIYSLGLGLVGFFFNLAIFGWALGAVVAGLILRFGMGAESLAWGILVAFAPFCAVYYPVDILPAAVQPIALALPPSYVFEGMRAILIDHVFRADLMLRALVLNALYLAAGVGFFFAMMRVARRRGMLLQLGE